MKWHLGTSEDVFHLLVIMTLLSDDSHAVGMPGTDPQSSLDL